MQVLFRTDSSIQIGSGHVMRCLTLANMLRKHDAEVIFACRNLEGNLIEHIKDEGFEVFELANTQSTSTWNLENWVDDVYETMSFIHRLNKQIDLVIVDHYAIDFKWEKTIRPYTKKIMVIDDLADRKHDCDILLDQNYYLNKDDRYEGLVPQHCKLLLGPNYILLRDEFFAALANMSPRKGNIERILVFFGGTDPTNETEKTLQAIKKLSGTLKFHTDVVVGNTNPNRSTIKELCSEIPRTRFYCQVNNMAELMTNADLAIGAGGSATWERCFLKLPSITIIVADNQEKVSIDVAKARASILLGKSQFVKSSDIAKVMERLLYGSEIIEELSINCGKLIDTTYILNDSLVSEILR